MRSPRARPAPGCCPHGSWFPGEVPERLNGTDSKSVVHASVPWVQIPPSPPLSSPTFRCAILSGPRLGDHDHALCLQGASLQVPSIFRAWPRRRVPRLLADACLYPRLRPDLILQCSISRPVPCISCSPDSSAVQPLGTGLPGIMDAQSSSPDVDSFFSRDLRRPRQVLIFARLLTGSMTSTCRLHRRGGVDRTCPMDILHMGQRSPRVQLFLMLDEFLLGSFGALLATELGDIPRSVGQKRLEP